MSVVQLQTVESHGDVLQGLYGAAVADLTGVYREVERLDPIEARNILLDTVPLIVDPYASAVGDVSATFYEQVRDEVRVRSLFTAVPAEIPEPARYESLVRWAVAPLFAEEPTTSALMLLAGGVQKILGDVSRDSVVASAAGDRVKVGYQRVPRSGCCAFCAMLASRGAAYSSDAAAGGVLGRGVPVGKHKLAKGIKQRGIQNIGQDFHDHCKCRSVPVFEDNWVEMQEGADRQLEAYVEARNRVSAKRAADGYQGFGDQAASQKMILAEMRSLLGSR